MRPSFTMSLALVLMAGHAGCAAETVKITADGRPAAVLTLPPGWSAAGKDAKAVLLAPGGAPHVQAWSLDSRTIVEAEKAVAQLVAGEVTDFTVTAATTLTIAGGPARQLVGTGKEADDGDPANAEVTFFTVGGRVFLLIAHGEGDGTTKRHGEIAGILASAAAP
jgi:hypothetical protein